MSEKAIMREVMLAASTPRSRLHRNNVGEAWLGPSEYMHARKTVTLQPGDVVVRHAKRVKYGLAVGSCDLIGHTTLTIAPQHVGRDIAVFTAIECKDGSAVTQEQLAFIALVRSMGGIAGVAESVRDYHAVTHEYLQRSST